MMMKRIVGVVAGIVVAGVTIFAVEMVNSRLFPGIADAATAGNLSSAPVGALALVVLGWALGTTLGGMVATRIAQRGWPAWVVAGFVIAGVVANAAMIPHPVWMTAAGILLPLIAGWVVSRSAAQREAAGAAPAEA